MSLTSTLTYLTDDLPGIGGRIKERPEDFLVEEQPLYQPSGQGEHLYLFVEKVALTTPEAVRRIAKAFRVKRSDVGYAGMKDKHAITRQHFSIYLPGRGDGDAELLHNLDHHAPQLKILWAERHANKLRQGHLAGNRFVIRIRQVQTADVLVARKVLDRISATGIPNFLGEQRFGYRQNSHTLGKLLLLGQYEAFLDEMLGHAGELDSPPLRAGREAYEKGDYAAALELWPWQLRFDRQALDALRQGRSALQVVRCIDRGQREFLICALQSAMFNAVLDRRLKEGSFAKLISGDLAWKHDNRSVFRVDEATAEKENGPGGRVAALEVSPSGPMWGPQMMQAQGQPGEMEKQALEAFGLTEGQLAGVNDMPVPPGKRRPMRVPLRDADISGGVDEHGAYIRLAFELPRGAFATMALREITKSQDAAHEDDAAQEEEAGG
jgi:tRNA pseudouridine13 synthase